MEVEKAHFNRHFIAVDFLPGTSIEEAIKKAIAMTGEAPALGVYFEFNGVRMLITNKSTVNNELAFFQTCLKLSTIKI